MSTYSPEVVQKALSCLKAVPAEGTSDSTVSIYTVLSTEIAELQEQLECDSTLATSRLELLRKRDEEIEQYKQGYGIPHEKFIERLNDANNGDYVATLLKSLPVSELIAPLKEKFKADELTWILLTTEELVAELKRRNYKGPLLEDFKCGMSLNEYQQNALITEAPVDEERWAACINPILGNIIRITDAISATKLDNTKKFAAYGKLPLHDKSLAITYTGDRLTNGPYYHPGVVVEDQEVYRFFHALAGIFTEAEELGEAVSTAVGKAFGNLLRSKSPYVLKLEYFDVVNLKEEIGDFFWYFALLADVFGFTLQECLELNEHKLQKVRYKLGKFTPEEAAQRDLAAEREALEGTAPSGILYNDVVAMKEKLEKATHIGVDLAAPGSESKTVTTPACSDCSGPLSQDGDIYWCPKCDDSLAAGVDLPEETTSAKPNAVRSEKNKNVWQALVDLGEDGWITHRAGQWFFTYETGNRSAPYAHEYLAIQKLEEYCRYVLNPSGQTPVDTSHDKCGYCGKTGHNITGCSEKAKLDATPEKLEEEKVPTTAAPPKYVPIPGDTVRSMRKSLQGYKFIFNRLASEGETIHERVAYCSVDALTPDNDAKLSLGEEIRLSPDELVKC